MDKLEKWLKAEIARVREEKDSTDNITIKVLHSTRISALQDVVCQLLRMKIEKLENELN